MTLKVDKSVTLTGQSLIDGQQAVYLNANITTETVGSSTISQNISNQELYNANRVACRKDISEFQEMVYEVEDDYIKDAEMQK